MFFSGTFTLVTPASLLQLLCQEQRSVIVTAWRGRQQAQVSIAEGLVVAARCNNLTGKEAVYSWLVWDSGQFQIDYLISMPEMIEMMTPYEELLLEAARRRDELETELPALLRYPQRQELETLLTQCPAVSGLAIISREGRLLGSIGLEDSQVEPLGAAASGLWLVAETLHTQPEIVVYATDTHRLLLVDKQTHLLLAVPAAGSSMADARNQIQQAHVDYP
ncbi:MAG: DUF4388 domain-containing protein [Chloroflexaceae bacterium]|nr:DUF4388 domain-containing protein [Chloroflexaceae bacterium]NJO05602.1 DUF4388 domain-containing protein [Chloroflexaceae bacterium]